MRTMGELEALVMNRLWDADEPQSVRNVLDGLSDGRDRAYTTVMTVLDNLFRKGFVERERSGRAWVYRATTSRDAHTAELMEDALASAGDRSAALLHFVDQLTEVEASELRALLSERGPA